MIKERNKLSIVVRERETSNIGDYKVYSSEHLLSAVQYAHEHDFPIDFYVNFNAVTKEQFRKAIMENVEFDENERSNNPQTLYETLSYE